LAEKSKDKRNYDNRSREELAKETRQNILNALAHQLIKNDKPDFSIDEAAQDAGVTKRTIAKRHIIDSNFIIAKEFHN
jgi:response regulator of citrate/malate metabolism